MSMALLWLHKEWLAQWRSLLAFVLLGCAALAIVAFGVDEQSWSCTDLAPHVLSWFLLVAGSAAMVVVAPQLVRGEFEGGVDHFLLRQPGALAPAWFAKMAFLAAASIAVLVACSLCGALVLLAMGRGWPSFVVRGAVEGAGVTIAGLPMATVVALALVVLAPWVAASAACLPRGRMGVGVVALVATAAGSATVRVLGGCPGLLPDIVWWPWIAAVWPAGVALFAFVWAARRRGALLRPWVRGVVGCGALLAVPAFAFGSAAWNYHHAIAPARMWGLGITPDGRCAVVLASSQADQGVAVPWRIDLELGIAHAVGGTTTRLDPGTTHPWPTPPGGRHRFWRYEENGGRGVFDAVTGGRPGLDKLRIPKFAAEVRADARAFESVLLPRGGRAWRGDDTWLIEREGKVQTVSWPLGLSRQLHRPAGQGALGDDQRSVFDLERLAMLRLPQRCEEAIACDGEWLVATAWGRWFRFDVGRNELEPRPELDRAMGARGPVGDGVVLLLRGRGPGRSEDLVVHRPATRRTTACELPADFVQPEILVSLGPDSRGRTWIGSRDGKLIAVDPMTARLESVPARGNAFALLGNDVFTVEDSLRVVRTDYTTGTRTVLYPR